ncbi:MAG: PDDEXK nuclease domain-containing protein [Spirochaetaceae bacterium]|jgi:hypothetical protein|nr:PDDEXK nuclease domain-containing protein [Spirochaetaceae bacterium]
MFCTHRFKTGKSESSGYRVNERRDSQPRTKNYFKEEENTPDDSPPVGIVMAADKDEILVDYATGSISNQLFVSKYQLYIPDKKVLENELRLLLAREQDIED